MKHLLIPNYTNHKQLTHHKTDRTVTKSSLDDGLLLLDEELDDLLLLLALVEGLRVGVHPAPEGHPLLQLGLVLLRLLLPVGLEVVEEVPPLLDERRVGLGGADHVLGLELGRVLLHVLLDLLDLLLGEQAGGAGPPEELAELLQEGALQNLALRGEELLSSWEFGIVNVHFDENRNSEEVSSKAFAFIKKYIKH